jgi:ABC-type uncharacterized transport system involved in gliding motility auxiliary subunit
MGPQRFALTAGVCALVLALATIVTAQVLLRPLRLDATQDGQFSLEPASLQIIAALQEPVSITLINAPSVQGDAMLTRARALLQAFAYAPGAKVRINQRNAPPDQAAPSFTLEIANAVNDVRQLGPWTPQNISQLEYDIASAVVDMTKPKRKTIGLITSLPTAADQAGEAGVSLLADLATWADLKPLARDFTILPKDIEALAILHPWRLDGVQLFAVDQYLLAGGRAFVAVDPAFLGARSWRFDPVTPPPPSSSSLDPLLPAYGVTLSQEVVLDLDGALPLQTRSFDGALVEAPQPLYFRARFGADSASDSAIAGLNAGLNLGGAGALMGATAKPLAVAGGRTARMAAFAALASPSPQQTLAAAYSDAGAVYAVRMQGRLTSAFATAPTANATHLKSGAVEADLVVIADADFLLDRYYRGGDPGSADSADNAAFVRTALAALTGDGALADLRGRPVRDRRMASAPAWLSPATILAAPMLLVLIAALVYRRRPQ